MSKIHIADGLSFPLDVVTQTLAAIGRKGAGKTYLSQMLCEKMLDAEAQTVALDAVGNWFGLRIGADGKSKGKDIFVIGGDHGDVPLVAGAGAQIARLLVEKHISAVLDVSGFRIGERKRFATDFAEELFHLKKSQRSPVHLFIEEAQLFVPQRIGHGEERMYGAFESIIRIGRNYGIGCTMISQRPQSINKEVLSQVECLCVLQVNGTHERKALEEWVQEAGADRALVGQLPGLHQGEGYVWSPSWLRTFQRVWFDKKVTFDASATPEVGKAVRATKLSEVDVESLRESMKDIVEEAERDDPKALRKQIAALQREISQRQVVEKPVDKIVEVSIVCEHDIHRIETIANALREDCERVPKALTTAAELANKLLAAVEEARRTNSVTLKQPVASQPKFLPKPVLPKFVQQAAVRAESNGKLRAGAERMLAALVQWNPASMPEGQMRSHARMKKSGTFSTYMSDLRRGGYIEQTSDGWRATQAGLDYFGGNVPQAPSTTEEALAIWNPKLREGARRMLEVLVGVRGRSMTREQLAEAVGMAVSGTFSTYLSDLRRARLIETSGGVVQANKETLFL